MVLLVEVGLPLEDQITILRSFLTDQFNEKHHISSFDLVDKNKKKYTGMIVFANIIDIKIYSEEQDSVRSDLK